MKTRKLKWSDGFIQTRPSFQTKEHHIYAIGDVIGGLQLAHVASHEGIAAVEHIAGLINEPIDYTKIARCIYSSPEAACVGMTEQQANDKDSMLKSGSFHLRLLANH